jgi:hypothetical protein
MDRSPFARMPIHKAEQPSVASPEHFVAQQAAYLTAKYKALFTDQSSSNGNRQMYAYPPPKPSAQEGEMRALEENAAKHGHGVPLSSRSMFAQREEGRRHS